MNRSLIATILLSVVLCDGTSMWPVLIHGKTYRTREVAYEDLVWTMIPVRRLVVDGKEYRVAHMLRANGHTVAIHPKIQSDGFMSKEDYTGEVVILNKKQRKLLYRTYSGQLSGMTVTK